MKVLVKLGDKWKPIEMDRKLFTGLKENGVPIKEKD